MDYLDFFFKKKINFWSNENNILLKYNYKHLLNVINGLREIIVFNKEKHFQICIPKVTII